ncbi:MAG: IS200/IS605 family transposase [Akkermansia sp.]|nr:IS200/IS605 family transposase [Akkermansia sp.]
MGRSYTKIIIHIIFHVKDESHCIEEHDLTKMFNYICGVIRNFSGYVYAIGGRPDHVHILASTPVSMSLSDFVRTIKANSSKWIKTIHKQYAAFSWQEGYGAFSVSETNTKAVIQYIKNQKLHHQTKSAQEEFIQILERSGLLANGVANDTK